MPQEWLHSENRSSARLQPFPKFSQTVTRTPKLHPVRPHVPFTPGALDVFDTQGVSPDRLSAISSRGGSPRPPPRSRVGHGWTGRRLGVGGGSVAADMG